MTDLRRTIDRATGPTGSTIHLYPGGALDREAGRHLRRALRDAFAAARRGRVVVDMSAVDEIGSECIETLLTGYTRALAGGHGFEVVNAHGHVRQALAVTGLCPPADDDLLYAPAWPDVLEFNRWTSPSGHRPAAAG